MLSLQTSKDTRLADAAGSACQLFRRRVGPSRIHVGELFVAEDFHRLPPLSLPTAYVILQPPG